MRTKKLSVTLTGSDQDGGDVILDDLQGFCAALTACLRTCEKRICSQIHLDYRIVGLRRGSCSLTIQPGLDKADSDKASPKEKLDPSAGAEVIELFDKTVRALETGKPLDSRLSCHDLRDFKRLAHTFKVKVRSIQFGRFRITQHYTENIRKLLAQPTIAEGEVTGTLERVDVHERSSFTLFPNLGGPVVC